MLHTPNIEREGAEPSPLRLRALSLSAGVQSTTLALMAAHGEIVPMPDCAIFADTGWEPQAVYDHFAWLMSPNVLPFPVHIVSDGNIREQLIAAGQGNRWASIPAFAKTVTPAGAVVPVFDEDDEGELIEVATRQTTTERVSIGMIRRQCTTLGLVRRSPNQTEPDHRSAFGHNGPAARAPLRGWHCDRPLPDHRSC